jgi:hypothetical protein
MQCIVESEHTNTIVVETIAVVGFSLWAELGMKPSKSVLIYFYLTGQCISALAKTYYTLNRVHSLVCLSKLKRPLGSCNGQPHSWQQMRLASQTESRYTHL